MENQPIRILQVVGKMHYGGMETLIMNLYRNIDRNKVQFDFLVHYDEPGEYDEEILKLGGKIYKMPRTIPTNYFKYKRALKMFFDEHKEYKVVHGHLQATAFMYHKIGKSKSVKCCITHAHTTGVEKKLKDLLGRKLSLLAQKYTDYFFGCSVDACRYFFPNAINSNESIFIIKNGIQVQKYVYDYEKRKNIRKNMKLQDKLVIGHIGRFSEVKNHEFLLKIFYEVHKKNKNSVLLLIGKGSLEEKIKIKVKELCLEDCVIFLGTRSDIPDLLQAMDIFLLPSKYEGLGIALIEAQASGLKSFTSEKTVPKATKITDLLEYVSLEKSPEYWAKKILETNTSDRKDTSINIKTAGYDIKETANWIEKFYINKYN